MPIRNYTELCDAVASEISRRDLKSSITNWVHMAEIFAYRYLKTADEEQYTTGNFIASQAYIQMPQGFKRPLHIEIQTATLRKLKVVTWDRRTDVLENDTSAYPRVITFLGRRGYLAPVPTTTDQYHLFYVGQPTPLSEENPVNDLLELGPDALLYGALMYAGSYLANAEQFQIWKAIRDEALSNLKREYADATLLGSGTRIRTDWAPGDGHK